MQALGDVAGAFEAGRLAGRFDVVHGRGLLARLIARAGRFPEAGRDVPVDLSIASREGGTRWTRRFPGRLLVTDQRFLGDSVLAERLGLVECAFRVERVPGGVRLVPCGARACLGALRIPLPARLSPRVAGTVGALAERRFRIEVTIDAPFAGRVLSYSGLVSREEDPR